MRLDARAAPKARLPRPWPATTDSSSPAALLLLHLSPRLTTPSASFGLISASFCSAKVKSALGSIRRCSSYSYSTSQSHHQLRTASFTQAFMTPAARNPESTSFTSPSNKAPLPNHRIALEMASLPSLPPLGPIVLQFPFGFDATLDAGPSTTRQEDAPDNKSMSGDSSMRKVAFARAEASSELGGDAAVPEAVPVSEPVSVPEAVTAPESTAVPEVVTNEVVAPPEPVVTTVPAPEETVVNEVPTECPTKKVETVEAAEPVPAVRRASTVVVTVPAEAAEEQSVAATEPRPLSRKSTTITITVAENEAAPPPRKASLPTPRAQFVNAESVEAPVRSETVKLEGGTSVTVTEAPPVKETRKKAKKVKTKKVRVVKRVRVMSLWRRILAKVMRKRAEQKAEKAMGVDGTLSPQDATENSVRPGLDGSVNRRPEPEVASNTSEMRTCDSSRVAVDEFFSHDGATQSDAQNPTDAASSRQETCTASARGS
ncbi:hypothetical protein HDK77DRAFT_40168 [Phyllosticta capitalensis]